MIIEQNGIYSSTHVELMQLLASEKLMREQELTTSVEAMQNYEYSFCNWPVIISKKQSMVFDQFVKTLPALIFKVINQRFGQDYTAFANYINESEFVCRMLLNMGSDPRDLLIRHDVIIADQKIKLIEVNAGSRIGGWQLDWIYPSFAEVLKRFSQTSEWNLENRPIVSNMFLAILKSILRRRGANASGNILVLVDNPSSYAYFNEVLEFLRQQYRIAQKGLFPNGKLVICHDASEVTIKSGGEVYCHEEEIDGAIIPTDEGTQIDPNIYFSLSNSHLRGKLVFPDSPYSVVIGNKALLALLHDAINTLSLSEAEVRFIRDHIPWTTKLINQRVTWCDETIELSDLLMSHRENLVIKKSNSMQGRDVFIGKNSSPEEWKKIYQEYCADNDWLVQGYCEPDLMSVCHPESGVIAAKSVWGIFDFGGSYSGAFIRAMPATENKGVINSATGATELLVLEEATQARKIKI